MESTLLQTMNDLPNTNNQVLEKAVRASTDENAPEISKIEPNKVTLSDNTPTDKGKYQEE